MKESKEETAACVLAVVVVVDVSHVTDIKMDVANVAYWRDWILEQTPLGDSHQRAIPKDRARFKIPTICLILGPFRCFLFEHQGGLLWLLEVIDHQGSRQVGIVDHRVGT